MFARKSTTLRHELVKKEGKNMHVSRDGNIYEQVSRINL